MVLVTDSHIKLNNRPRKRHQRHQRHQFNSPNEVYLQKFNNNTGFAFII